MRIKVGMFMVVLSYVLGWPAVAAVAAVAAYFENEEIAVAGGTAFYLFSWVLLGAGIWVGGPEAVRRVRARLKGKERPDAPS